MDVACIQFLDWDLNVQLAQTSISVKTVKVKRNTKIMPSLSSLTLSKARASMRIKERNGDIVEEEEDLITVDQDPIGWKECNNSKNTSNNNNNNSNNNRPNLAQLQNSWRAHLSKSWSLLSLMSSRMSHKLLRMNSKKINRKRSTNKRNPNNRMLIKLINQPYNPALSKSNPNLRLSKQRRLKS